MKENANRFAVGKMCQVFGVGRSGYYNWLNAKGPARTAENRALKSAIMEIYEQSGSAYGSPKITKMLETKGISASRPRVARHMKEMGIKSIRNHKYRVCTTESGHGSPIAENLLDRDFSAQAPGEKWVSDITYVPVGGKWIYLTVVIDLFDRKVIGWAISKGMATTETTVKAWQMAITNRKPKTGLMFHSDRGVQYAAKEFRGLLDGQGATQSMSRKGNCWDNAVAESFFRTIKSEKLNHHNFNSFEQAKREIFMTIEIWYNRKRIHQALGYRTPEQLESQHLKKVA